MPRPTSTSNAWFVRYFDSVRAFADAAAARWAPDFNLPEGSRDNSRSHTPTGSWDHNIGFDGMQELVRTGWVEQAANLERLTTEALIAARETLVEQTYVASDCPDFASDLDVGAYCSGEVAHWVTCEDDAGGSIRGTARAVHLAVRGAYHCGETAEDMRQAVTLAVGVALGCMAHGVPVTLDAVYVCRCLHGRDAGYAHIVRILSPGNVPDYARLATVTHPGMFRRLGFAVAEADHEACVCTRSPGYGRPCSWAEVALSKEHSSQNLKGAPAPDYDLVVEPGTGQTAAQVKKMINDVLQKAGR